MFLRTVIFLLLLPVSAGKGYGQEVPTPEFENAAEESTESGYIGLSWKVGENHHSELQFEVQQADNIFFTHQKTLYKGEDYATFLSGLKNGQYYFRVRSMDPGLETSGAWSKPVMVTVRHHSLSLSFTLFTIGAVVFLLTVLIVVRGNRNVNRNPNL